MSFSTAEIKDYYNRVVACTRPDQFKEVQIICKTVLDHLPRDDHDMRPKFLSRYAKVASTPQEAFEAIEEAINLCPQDNELLSILVEICSSREHFRQAKSLLGKAIEEQGYTNQLTKLMATTELMLGEIVQAEQTLAQTAQTPDIQKERISLKYQLGDLYGADDLLQEYLDGQPPDTAQDAYLAAFLCSELLEFDRSHNYLDRALELEPFNPDYLSLGIRLANWRGDQTRTKELLDRSHSVDPPHPFLLSLIIHHDPDVTQKTVAEATAIADRIPDSNALKTSLLFALAQYYDRTTDYEKAWSTLVRANDLSAGQDPHRFQRLRREAAQARGTNHFNSARSLANGLKTGSKHDVEFVYLVGAPRTGSSLIQSVLTANECVGSLSERAASIPLIDRYVQKDDTEGFANAIEKLSAADIAGARRQGLSESILVDKSTITLFFLGLIAKIHPTARFINVVRDPRDVALSMFFHEFPHTFGYTTNLLSIADEISHRIDVVDGWREDGFAIESVQYESFVSNPQREGRRLADYIGVDWSDQFLDTEKRNFIVPTFSAKQVRKPISTDAIGKWKKYERFFDKEALELLTELSNS